MPRQVIKRFQVRPAAGGHGQALYERLILGCVVLAGSGRRMVAALSRARTPFEVAFLERRLARGRTVLGKRPAVRAPFAGQPASGVAF